MTTKGRIEHALVALSRVIIPTCSDTHGVEGAQLEYLRKIIENLLWLELEIPFIRKVAGYIAARGSPCLCML